MKALPIVVGVTGASGSILAKYFVEALVERSLTALVICTQAGRRVWRSEVGGSFEEWIASLRCRHYDIDNIAAPMASGTYRTQGMVVIPCSMGTLAAIAHGLSQNLLERAADVTLKERRPMILVPRESPLSAIHLENMLSLARLGVRLIFPLPAYYTHPRTLEEVNRQVVGRVLDALGIESALAPHQRYEKEIE